MTKPTLNIIPDAGRNGTSTRASPIPDGTLSLADNSTCTASISTPRYRRRDQTLAKSDRDVTMGMEPNDQSQHSAEGDRSSQAFMA